jgi:ring-1,2-phenylacetyl-CoA epoxidase subunit PaaD
VTPATASRRASTAAPRRAAEAAPIEDVTEAQVRELLATVHDPEIPAVSIVDLGVVEGVAVTAASIEVELLPTFVGCPALDVIRASVEEALAPLGRPTSVAFTWRVPWTSDRISPLGRDRLARAGFAPPADPDEVRCPYCGSGQVVMDSLFGPTQCRSLFYCRGCRQPFEAFKPV